MLQLIWSIPLAGGTSDAALSLSDVKSQLPFAGAVLANPPYLLQEAVSRSNRNLECQSRTPTLAHMVSGLVRLLEAM